jgi:aryl-alcohol dehydrogenase-like predicted oxidoreductase
MRKRQLGPFKVSAIGYGCMNLSHGYGPPLPDSRAEQLLLRAVELGIDLFDTAMLYGSGLNETLLGKSLKPYRQQITLCTKGGMAIETDPGKPRRRIDSRPEVIQQNCEESLKRLQTDVIDVYYLHRWDKQTPIEEVIGAMAGLVKQGKIRAIGLSEVSANTLAKAHAVHPIAAVQSEYSLWTRNPEIALAEKCRDLNVALVAFSPLGRGFLAGLFSQCLNVDHLHDDDMRKKMPRFSQACFAHNMAQYQGFARLAMQADCTSAQLALAWLLSRGDHVIPIAGSRQVAHLEENLKTAQITISKSILEQAGQIINQRTIRGCRYDAIAQAAVDTEDFSSESPAG